MGDKNLLFLSFGWGAWCLLHSTLAADCVKKPLQRCLGRYRCGYRLGYNVLALLTLIPLAAWTLELSSPLVISWQWPWIGLQVVLWGVAGVLFVAGLRSYPVGEFLGIDQIRDAEPAGEMPGRRESAVLVRSGVLGLVRHPWYLAGLLVLWARDLNRADMVAAGVLSVYLLVGARLEETRLLRVFGPAYRRYRQEVSMFLPWKWLKARLGRGGG